mgnify:CR=1 FL=1
MGKKRANSEGSIRKRKDSRWEGFYTASYDPATGKQKIKNVLGKTQAEVKEKLKKAIADSQRLDMNRSGTHTVKSWVQMWYEVYAEPRLRENTKDYYLNYINNHIIPQLGDIKLDKLTTIQIQKFYNDLQKNGRVQRYQHIQLKNKGLSVRVVHGIHTLLNNCLEQAVSERLILVNPARGCKLPKMEKREMKVLPEEKIRPYLMEADKRELLALLGWYALQMLPLVTLPWVLPKAVLSVTVFCNLRCRLWCDAIANGTYRSLPRYVPSDK